MKNNVLNLVACLLLLGCTNLEESNQTTVFNETIIKAQFFEISNSDTVLTSAKGCKLYIEENAFLLDNVVYKGNIQLTFKEILTKSDLVLSSIATVSNGRLLESAGMIQLQAFGEGKELELGEKKVKVFIPTEQLKTDMQVFQSDTNEDDKLN